MGGVYPQVLDPSVASEMEIKDSITSTTEDWNSVISNSSPQERWAFVAQDAQRRFWAAISMKAKKMLAREAHAARADQARLQRLQKRHADLMQEQVRRKREKLRRSEGRFRAFLTRQRDPTGDLPLPVQMQTGGDPGYLHRDSDLPPVPVVDYEVKSREASDVPIDLLVRSQPAQAIAPNTRLNILSVFIGSLLGGGRVCRYGVFQGLLSWTMLKAVIGSSTVQAKMEEILELTSWWGHTLAPYCAGYVNTLTTPTRYLTRQPLLHFYAAMGEVYIVGCTATYFSILFDRFVGFPGVGGVVYSILFAPTLEECFKRVSPAHCEALITLESVFKIIQGPGNVVAALLVGDSHKQWASERLERGIHHHTINNILAACLTFTWNAYVMSNVNFIYIPIFYVLGSCVFSAWSTFQSVATVFPFLPGVDLATKLQVGLLYDTFVKEGGLETSANIASFGLSAMSGGVNVGNVVQLLTAVSTQGRGPSLRGAVELVCLKFLDRAAKSGVAQPQSFEIMSAKGINAFGEFVVKVSQLTNNDLLRAVTCLYSSFLLIPVIVGTEEGRSLKYLEEMNLVDDHMFSIYKKSKSQFAVAVLESAHAGLAWFHASVWGSSMLRSPDALSKLLTEVSVLKAKRDRIRTTVGDEPGDWITFSEYQRRVTAALAQTGFLMAKKGLPPTMLSTFQRASATLHELQVYLDTTFNSATKRERAIALVLTGKSSTGKSKVEDLICSSYLRFRGLLPDGKKLNDPDIGQYIAKKTSSDKYDSTIYNHTHIYVEEECNTSKMDKGSPDVPHYLTRMLAVVDEQNTPVNKADLEDKGRVTLKAALAIFVTNAPFAGIRAQLNNESVLPAIGRAYFIEVSTRAEFRRDGRIDPVLVDQAVASGRIKDHSEITLYSVGRQKQLSTLTYKQVDAARYVDEPDGMEWSEPMSTPEFVKWLGRLYCEQRDTMNVSRTADEAYSAVRCLECGETACRCALPVQPQVGGNQYTWLDETRAWCEASTRWLVAFVALSTLRLAFRGTPFGWLWRWQIVSKFEHEQRRRWGPAYAKYAQIHAERAIRRLNITDPKERLKRQVELMHWALQQEEASVPELWDILLALKILGAAVASGAAMAVVLRFLSGPGTADAQGAKLSTPSDHGDVDLQRFYEEVGAGRPRANLPKRERRAGVWEGPKTPVTVSSGTGHPRSDTEVRVKQQIWPISVTLGETTVDGMCLIVAPNVVAVNRHLFGDEPEGKDFIVAIQRSGWLFQGEHSVISYRNGDTVLCRGDAVLLSATTPNQRSIVDLLPDEILQVNSGEGWWVSPRGVGDLKLEAMRDIMFPECPAVGNVRMYQYRGDSFVPGDCVSPVFLTQRKDGHDYHTLIGFHAGSYVAAGIGYATPLSRAMVQHFTMLQRKHNNILPVAESAIPISAQAVAPTPGDNIMWIQGAHGTYHGTYDVPITKIQMTARPSAFRPFVKELFGVDPDEFVAPIGKRGKHLVKTKTGFEHVYLDPVASYTKKALVTPSVVSEILVHPDILEHSIAEYLQRLDEQIDWPVLTPLTMEEAISGLQDFIRPMNLKSSAGPGLEGLKSQHVEFLPGETRWAVPMKDVVDRFLRYVELVDQGLAQPLLVKAVPKDEVREMKWQRDLHDEIDIYAPKPARMFFVSQFSDLIHQKMFLGPLFAVLESHPEAAEHIIGIDTCSPEWEELYNWFSTVQNRMFDGDVRGWDCAFLVWLCAFVRAVLVHIAKRCGYNDEAIRHVITRCCSDANLKVLIQRTLIGLFNQGPSGSSDTTMKNSLAMSGFYRILYYTSWCHRNMKRGMSVKITLSFAPRFSLMVRLRSNGDDSICGVEIECDWFDQVVFVRVGNQLGVACTPGDKSDETTPFRSIHDVTMLKRRFREDPETGLMMAPLPMKSLAKALSMFTETSISDRDRDIEAVRSVLYELVQHGRAEFQSKEIRIREIMTELGFTPHLPEGFFKTFDAIVYERYGLSYTPLPRSPAAALEYQPSSRQAEVLREAEQALSILPQSFSTMDTTTSTSMNVPVTLGDSATMTMTPGSEIGYTAPSNALTAAGAGANSSIEDFLRRPVKIATWSWQYNTAFSNTIQPWKLWVSNSAVQYKLRNYNLIRGNLRVSLQVVGSPFMYGRALVGYIPFDQYNDTWQGLLNGVNGAELRSIRANYLSQTVCGYLDGSKVHTVEFTLPFFCPTNWIQTNSLEQWERMGALYTTLLCPLLWGNAGTLTSTVNVNVFCWMEDLELSGSTINQIFATLELPVVPIRMETKRHHGKTSHAPPPVRHVVASHPGKKKTHRSHGAASAVAGGNTGAGQAKTAPASDSRPPPSTNPGPSVPDAPASTTFAEQAVAAVSELQESRIISKTADSVAGAAASLSGIPVIGTLAKATSFVASGVSSVAKWFGFSRPPLLTDHTRNYISNYGDYAVTTTFDPVSKLSLDPKQEVTIDPTIAGVGADDELAYANIWSREACLTTFQYASTAAVNDLLFRCAVTPDIGTRALYIKSGGTNYTVAHQALPMQLASLPYSWWKGTIIFRFEIIASSFHRGKIGIFYEPNISMQATGDANPNDRFNLNQVAMVDLSEETNVEIAVQWGQPQSYARIEDAESGSEVKYYPVQDRATYVFSNTINMAQSQTNGFIEIRAINALAGAVDPPTPVYISVFMRAEDLELQAPSDLGIGVPQLYPATLALPIQAQGHILNPTDHVDDEDQAVIYFGEKNYSFRTLLKRVVGYCTNSKTASPSANQYIYNDLTFGMYPVMTTSYKYGNANLTAYLADGFTFPDGGTADAKDLYDILRRCYVGVRGSMTYKITGGAQDLCTTAMVRRSVTTSGTLLDVAFASGSASFTGGYNSIATIVGAQRFDTRRNANISFNIPHYAGYKFHFCQSPDYGDLAGDATTPWPFESNAAKVWSWYRTPVAMTSIGIGCCVEKVTGEDFQLLYYVATPTWYFPDLLVPP